MWTVTEAPGIIVPMVQVRVWEGAVPVMAQPLTGVVMDQLMPVPPGSGSLMTTPVAVPWELLVTVTVKPMLVPAETLGASAVFTMVRATPTTVVGAVEVTVAALVAVAVAVLL